MFDLKKVSALLLITIAVNSAAPQDERNQKILKCPSTSSCNCIDYTELEIQCPRFEPKIFVRLHQQNKYVHFECENITNNEYELVPEMKIDEARFLQITRCPLPHGKSVSSYLKNIQIERIRSLQFVSSGVNFNIPVEKQHFRGLGDIEMFDLRGMENEIKELPSGIFDEMKKLTWVRIRVPNIHLPADLFESLESLEFLELGHNKLQSLEPGFLRNQKKLQKLNLWGNSLRNLNKDSFIGLDLVDELDLSANGIESVEHDLLFHLTNLTEINLSTNNFATLPEGLFANNRKLKTFKLLENRVTMDTLPSELLANLTSLEIVLIKCELAKLPEDIFEGSHMIKTIRLENNKLDDLPDGLFRDQKSLEKLDLSGNLISQLGDEFFHETSELQELKLSKNRMTSISSDLFRFLTKLKSLYLDNNLISNIDSKAFLGISSIEFITLQNNQLTLESEIYIGEMKIRTPLGSPFQQLEQLVTLNLANNSITSLFQDFTLTNLKSLNLSHNKISVVQTDEFQSLSRDGLVIDLSNNQIEEFMFSPSSEDARMPSISVVLNSNPVTCDCKLWQFVKHLQNKNLNETETNIKFTINELKCAQPASMSGKMVSEVDPMNLICPLDNEGTSNKLCPDGCTCDIRPEDKHLAMECDETVQFNQLPLASRVKQVESELRIQNKNLTSLPQNPSGGYKEITKLIANDNELTDIFVENLPPNIRILEIQNNKLQTINITALNFLSNSTTIEHMKLSGNPWSCGCENHMFLSFVQRNYKKIDDFSDVQCTNGKKFNDLKKSDICSDDNLFIIIMSIVTALLGLLLGGLAALYYKYQKQIKMWLYSHNMCLWFVTEEELDKDKKFDAFVSYSHRDQDFVADYLLPELEMGTIPYKLCVHERDWSPGLEISTQISNSVNDAKRTIIVMSPNYLQSNWAQWEFKVAQSHATTEKMSRIIVILFGDIGDIDKLEPDIRDYLKLNTYVKWGDKWFWEKLKYAMPHVKSSGVEKTRGLVKSAMKSSVDDKLELIKPISVTPPQLTTPPAEKVANPLIASLNEKNTKRNGKVLNGYNGNGHINGAYVINTSSRQSDV